MSYIGAVYSFGKYIPEFRAALGPAFKVIHEAMMAESFHSNLETIARTGTARVVPFDKLLEKLPAVKEEFGDTSPEYIMSTLQLRLKGLRGELRFVVVVSRHGPGADETPNYFYRKGSKLVIRDFKTREHHKKYNFTLQGELKRLIEKSLRKRPRFFLIGDNMMGFGAVGNMLKKTLGVKVNHIRHSMISTLLDKDHTETNARKIAELFHREWRMTMRYYNNDVNVTPGPDPNIISQPGSDNED